MINVYRLICMAAFAIAINAQCDYSSPDGDYKASWYLDSASQIVHFKLSAKQRLPGGYWTGIGFGGKMQGGDIITVSSVNNQVTVADRQGIGFSEPIQDGQQDVKDFKGKLESGVIHAEFSRAVETGDSQDLPIIDKAKNNCQDFIFPVSGGAASAGAIQKHSNTPVVQKICHIDQCPAFGGSGSGQPTSETKPTGTSTGEPAEVLTTGPPTGNRLVGGAVGGSGLITDNSGSQTTTGGAGNQGTTTLAAILSGGSATTPPPLIGGSAINTGSVGGAETTNTGTTGGKPSGSSCSFTEGDYTASWAYEAATQSVRFTVAAPLSLNRWTGIGFGQTMQGADMIVVYDANGIVNVSDRHGIGHAEPLVDAHQDVNSFQNTYNGKVVQAQFTRKINTGDVDDLPLEDQQRANCQYFMFPVSGGILNVARDKVAMGIHTEQPKVQLICGLKSCTGGSTEAAGTPPPTVVDPVGAGSRNISPQPGAGGTGIGSESRPCAPRDDHNACKNYIDDYLNVVYAKFPRNDQITQKACGLLQTHQTGIVYTECCHYLSQTQVCGRFVGQQSPQPQTPVQTGEPRSAGQPQLSLQPQPNPNNNAQLQQPQNHNGLPGRPNGGK